MLTIGEYIKKLRANKNMSVRDLAEKLNFSASFLSQFEVGSKKPTDNLIEKLKGYFILESKNIENLYKQYKYEELKTQIKALGYKAENEYNLKKIKVLNCFTKQEKNIDFSEFREEEFIFNSNNIEYNYCCKIHENGLNPYFFENDIVFIDTQTKINSIEEFKLYNKRIILVKINNKILAKIVEFKGGTMLLKSFNSDLYLDIEIEDITQIELKGIFSILAYRNVLNIEIEL